MNTSCTDRIDIARLESLPELQGRLHRRLYPSGSAVFREGETSKVFLIVHRGLLKVGRSSGAGRDVITELLFPGDACGALCALDPAAYPVTATCVTDCELTVIPTEVLVVALGAHPELIAPATQVCRSKMRFQREMMVGMAVESAEQRAARVLLLLASRLGVREGGRIRMPAVLNRQEISELIGTTIETAIRVLSRFRKQGWIEERDGETILENEAALRELIPFSELS